MIGDSEPIPILIDGTVQIPRSEIQFRYSRSGGPGGQHVNKTETQVELLFDLAHSPHLTEEQRERAQARLSGYVDKSGILRVVASSTRSQLQNREQAIARFQALLARALHVPQQRHPTKPTAASRERRLFQKRRRSEIKRMRGREAGIE